MQHLDGDWTVVLDVVRQEYRRGAATPDRALDAIAAIQNLRNADWHVVEQRGEALRGGSLEERVAVIALLQESDQFRAHSWVAAARLVHERQPLAGRQLQGCVQKRLESAPVISREKG